MVLDLLNFMDYPRQNIWLRRLKHQALDVGANLLLVGIVTVIPASLWFIVLAETVDARPFPFAHLIGSAVLSVLVAFLVAHFILQCVGGILRILLDCPYRRRTKNL